MMKYVLKKLPKTSVLSLALGVTLFPVAISKKIQGVNIGANRVTANEDLASTIGTCMTGVFAPRHGIPFCVTCPLYTIDTRTSRKSEIPIDEWNPREVLGFRGLGWAARGVPMGILAFDVTATSVGPGLLTEQGNFGWASRKTMEPWLED
jgi:methylthioribose-1-phosphate isomerase